VETRAAMLAEAGAKASESSAGDDAGMQPDFRLTREGLWWIPPELDANDTSPVRECGPLRVVAATNDGKGGAWGVLLD